VQLDIDVAFPDEVAALTLKAFASRVRDKPTDIVDLWRCLEVAYAAGVEAGEFVNGDAAEAAIIIPTLFDRRGGAGMSALAGERSSERWARHNCNYFGTMVAISRCRL
jgi:hypothetical protein